LEIIEISEFIGITGFVIWAITERSFYFSDQQQNGGNKHSLGSYWLINLSCYGTMAYTFLDVWNWSLTSLQGNLIGLRLLGFMLIVLGITIRFLSRRTLGKQYSVHVKTSQDHELVTAGLYGKVRHPAYLGLLGLFLGIPLIMASWGGVGLAFICGLPALIYRIKIEEKFLSEWFGEKYDQYRNETWKLIPYLW